MQQDLPLDQIFVDRSTPLAKRVLVTGANGLLGQTVVEHLSPASDYTVLATAKDDNPRFSDVACEYTQMDVTDPERVRATFQEHDPDVVVNCAAMSDVAACADDRNQAWAVNARAVKRLAKRCDEVNARLIQISTDFVFDGTDGPYDESDRPNPVNYYGRTKLGGENALRDVGLSKWTIVRTVLLYGSANALSRSNVVLWIIDELSKGNSIHVVNDQWRTPTYVGDLAAGIEKIIDQGKDGIYHISGRELVTVYELAEQVAEVFGFSPDPIEPVSSDFFDDAVERPPKTGFLILKAETELGYDPHSLEEGLHALGQDLGLIPAS